MELIIAFAWVFLSLAAWFIVWAGGAAIGARHYGSPTGVYAGALFGWWIGLAIFIFGAIQFLTHTAVFVQELGA